jgi:hypothetical protein
MIIPLEQRCQKMIYRGHAWHQSRCERKAVRDGYCTTHDPERVKARHAASSAQWQAKENARKANYAEGKRLMEALGVGRVSFSTGEIILNHQDAASLVERLAKLA